MIAEQGFVLWFTGLSGSGKSTAAGQITQSFKAAGLRLELLDVDELRQTICKGLGFSREDRIENIRRIAYVSKLLSRHGIIVVVSAITPYQEMRDYLRNEIADYIEVYVECPLSECERRDVKGLYAKARNLQIAQFTGISDPYDIPERPDITINTEKGTAEANNIMIKEWLEAKGYLKTSREAMI